MLQIGRTVDRYLVEAEIGSGGMATVYRARHTTLGSLHALKVLKVQSEGIRNRLVQEGRVQATLRHPHIVAVTDVIDVDGAPGLVMEFIDGPALDKRLLEQRPSLAEAETLFKGIVSGVARAHRHGLVHRDLKPGNVLVDTDEDDAPLAKVTDFGLTKILAEDDSSSNTRSGIAMGTPSYMAPEQVRSAKNVDQRADMFALGCILYELTCGERAFDGEDTLETFNLIASGRYIPPRERIRDLPGNLVAAIEGCLVVDRERRVADCAALRAILGGNYVRRTGGSAPEPSGNQPRPVAQVEPAVRPVRENRTFQQVPTLSPPKRSETPGSHVSIDPFAEPPARSPVLPIVVLGGLGAGFVAVLIAGFIGWQFVKRAPPETPAPKAEPAVLPAAPEPEPPPAERPAKEEVKVEKKEPKRSAKPAVVPPKPEPEPPPPVIAEPPPAPAPEPDPGTVAIRGDATEVWLVGEGGSWGAGQVPPGNYKVRARFADGGIVSAGSVRVTSGQHLILSCSSDLQLCVSQ